MQNGNNKNKKNTEAKIAINKIKKVKIAINKIKKVINEIKKAINEIKKIKEFESDVTVNKIKEMVPISRFEFDGAINKIKEVASIKVRLKLFFKYFPIIFWQPNSMKEIVGPFATLFALNYLNNESYIDKYIGSLKIKTDNSKDSNEKTTEFLIPATAWTLICSFLGLGENQRSSKFPNDKIVSDEEAFNDLHDMVFSGKIKKLEELKKCCKENTKIIIGRVICDVVFDNLDVMYENKIHGGKTKSDVYANLGIPDWLIDCVFERYMERIMRKPDGHFYHLDESEEFMISYETSNDIERWLEEIVISTVQNIDIDPIRFAKYFRVLKNSILNPDINDPKGFVRRFYGDDMTEWDYETENRYGHFYISCIEDERYTSLFNKDSFGMLLLILLAKNIVGYGIEDYGIHECFDDFFYTLNPTEEQIKAAFSEAFYRNQDWVTEDERSVRILFPQFMNLSGEKFFRPIVQAIMEYCDPITMSELFRMIFIVDSDCSSCEEFYNNDLIEDGQFHIDDEKSKIILSSIDGLDDYQKLISIVVLSDHTFDRNFITALRERFRPQFDELFDSCVRNSEYETDRDFYKLLYRLVKHRKTIVLSKNQLECIKEIAETDEQNKDPYEGCYREKLLELFSDGELKKELKNENETVEDGKKPEKIINIREEDEEKEELEKNNDVQKKPFGIKRIIKFAKGKRLRPGGNKKKELKKSPKMLGSKREHEK